MPHCAFFHSAVRHSAICTARLAPGALLFIPSAVSMQVMSLWPFRQMILRGGQRQQEAFSTGLRPHALFQFGDATDIRRVLGMTNRLTGCAAHAM